MKHLLQEDYASFRKSYGEEQSYGLRLNPLKVSPNACLENQPFTLKKIPWIAHGYFYNHEERPGKHPYHDAGLYYIQEPSAMAVVELMDPKPGEKILDLAAAPGGKATQMASKMENKGLLIANEIHPKRAQILSRNIERLGIKNTVVTNEPPHRLARAFPAFFDRILVDAPCSGEGMFRKNEEAIKEWSLENVRRSQQRQLEILKEADRMLKEGGQLVYSTCTFSPEENEQVIETWLKHNPQYEVEQVETPPSFSHGRPEWTENQDERMKRTIRIWPHKVRGEGHFIAFLRKISGEKTPAYRLMRSVRNKNRLKEFNRFCKEVLYDFILDQSLYVFFGEELYAVPKEMPMVKSLKLIRPGWHLGTNKRNRFEPSHAFALGMTNKETKKVWDLSHTSKEVYAYLRGETFSAKGDSGWYLITVDGYSLGWGKLSQGMMKNHYPKGLRWFGH